MFGRLGNQINQSTYKAIIDAKLELEVNCRLIVFTRGLVSQFAKFVSAAFSVFFSGCFTVIFGCRVFSQAVSL